ncbi:phenylalanine--tRNA ligase subunit beta [Anoxybacter fermentans]|uniref:Phenylalanine--tRNA ligase beta subunit n=1 Tax=Anoxybacter fermentans TaxID=1323375 RepID=A0A3Q9HR08_9FIRM|nr:phenylalanine--tRNA ligase subunit beta [Anoxybacter fermentans]AZR73668.1 phenylalanine--tRNA ligase subunit beta [Anoxybacter fermentans]
MRVSYNWLKEYIDFNLTPEELAELLTQAGLEVDVIEYPGKGLEDIVIGEIKEITKHPNADKLSVTRVDVGNEELEIVCGAKNIFEGAKVPVAKIGVTLPNGMKIGKVKLRGVASNGMICSEDELGLKEERQAGVMIIDKDCKPGDSFVKIMGLDDAILVLDLTPNYAHCLSMIGVAREVAARIGKPLKKPEIKINETGPLVTELAAVEIKDPDLCPRYTARVIRGVKVGESPEWLKQRLLAAGMRPINNIVDVTNYVLMEMGQPLHAFDYDKVKDHKIIVRRAEDEEKIVTLDEKERQLDSNVLVICDSKEPICIAGVMGGANSEVTEETTTVLLESAYFNPISIRKTARRYGISSEASYRFERGVDIEAVIDASNRAAQLIQELAGGEIATGIIDIYPKPVKLLEIRLRTHRVNEILGTQLTRDEIAEMLNRLGFTTKVVDDDLDVTIPTYRGDVVREVDLIEEVARLYGYDNIPGQLPVGESRVGKLTRSQLLEDQTREFMNAVGFNETQNFSFINPKVYDMINLNPDHEWRNSIKLKNPISEEYAVMRRTLISDLLKVVSFNVKRRMDKIQIFELARVYIPTDDLLPYEPRMLAGAVMGVLENDQWNQNAGGFFYLKGILDAYANKFGLGELIYEKAQHDSFHPGRTALIKAKGEEIGYLGEIHPDVLANYDLKDRVTVFELNFEKIVELSSAERRFTELPKYPALTRDIALLVDEGVSVQSIKEVIRTTGAEYLESVELFDLYHGEQVPQGKKSVAFAMVYRAKDRTLTDEEVNAIIDQLLTRLKDELGAEIRG